MKIPIKFLKFLKMFSLKVKIGIILSRVFLRKAIIREMEFAEKHPRFVGNVEGFLISIVAGVFISYDIITAIKTSVIIILVAGISTGILAPLIFK